MGKRKSIFILLLLFLVACSNSVVDEARKTQANNDKLIKREEKSIENEKEKTKELYEKLEKPVEEVIQENDLEQRELADSENIVVKDTYDDPNEFAIFVADTLFKFQSGAITPEDYYDFLLDYGSKDLLETIPTDKKAGIAVYSSIQDLFKDSSADSFITSEVGLNLPQTEGYFYRQLQNGALNEYYITTIVKEDSGWKYKDDSPSPPFEITDSVQEGEKENDE